MRRVVLSVLVALTGVIAAGQPAGAVSQDGLSIAPNQTVTQTYGPLVGTFPANPDVPADLNPPSPDPDTCASVTSCDVIPLAVGKPSSLSVWDEFSLNVEVSWGAPGSTDDDLNVYLWYDPSTGNPGGSATTHNNPETLRFGEPVNGKYNLVVANASGVNNGYTVKVTLVYVHHDRPSELDSTSPTARPSSGGSGGASAPPSTARPPTSAPNSPLIVPSGAAPVVAGPTLSPEPVAPDSDLAALSGVGVATGTGSIFRTTSKSGGPAGKVPGPVLFFWIAIVPAAIAAGSGLLFLRFRPRALTIRVPS